MERFRCGVGILVAFFGFGVASSLFAQSIIPSDGTTVQLAHLEEQFRQVVDQTAPSVVAIFTGAAIADVDDAVRSNALNSDKLEDWLSRTTRTVGSGFIIDSNGYVLTNEHVIGQADQIWVATDQRKIYPAIVVGSDPRADLAVLKIPATMLKPVRFANHPVLRGMWTIALGNPYGLSLAGQMSMSVGVVSATERSLSRLATAEQRLYLDLIQTTAEINPGSSGGPLFNLSGEVIGIATAVVMPSKTANGIGFALPITSQLLATVDELKAGREIKYAYLGVMASTLTADQRQRGSIESEIGVRIDSIEPDSPAADALVVGDYVLAINDQPVASSDDFVRRVGGTPFDKPAKFNVRREGRPLTLMVRLRERALPSVAINRENQRFRWRGMLLGPIPANWDFSPAQRPDAGLMVLGIDAQSPMAGKGLHGGTIIISVAGKPVGSVVDLQQILNDTPAEQCTVATFPTAADAVVSGQ